MPTRKGNSRATPPFELLCQQVIRAREKGGPIKLALTLPIRFTTANLSRLPVKTIDKVKRKLKKKQPVADFDITKLVSILDVEEDICNRLESATFISILEILLQVRYSRQKERGVFLLAVRIPHPDEKRF